MTTPVLVLAALFATTPSLEAPADPAASVFNYGRSNAMCTGGGPFGPGTGSLTLVRRGSRLQTFSCQGTLEDPALAPSRTVRQDATCGSTLRGRVVYTPSGRFSVVCSGNR